MTNHEAIELLKIERDHMTPTVVTERVEAMDMAISALQALDKIIEAWNRNRDRDPIERQEVMDAIYKCTDIYVNNLPIMIYKAELYKAISEVPSTQPEMNFDEWCTDCKEYDHEKHCCPRWNRVIRQALKDAQQEPQYTELTPEEAASELASGSTMSAWYWLDDMMRLKQMGYAICRKKGLETT